jgi:iron complex outermembrane recepter protein
MKPTLIALGAAAACASALAQSAEQQPDDTPPPEPQRVEITGKALRYQAPPTTAATKTNTPILLTPQSVQVVPRAVINEQKALTLGDAIRNVAGTGSDFGFNGSAQPLLMLRGFQMESMTAPGAMSGGSVYFINGIKVKGLPINMANVDAVEVVKGPASVLYGRAEPGGLVNVVPRALSATPSWGFEQTLGQYSVLRTLLEGGGALNAEQTLLGRTNVSYDAAKSGRDFVENRLAAFSGTLAWLPDAQSRLALSFDHNAQKYRNDFGVPAEGDRPAALPRSTQFNDAPELSSVNSNTVVLDASTTVAEGWTAKGRVAVMRGQTQEIDVWPWRVNLGAGPTPADTCADTVPLTTLCRYYFNARPDGRIKLDQLTLDLQGQVQVGGLQHQLLVELEHHRTEKTGLIYTQQLASVDVRNPVLGNTPPLDTSMALASQVRDEQRWTSLVAQDQVAFGGGWHGVLAVRHDRTEAIFSSDPAAQTDKKSFTTPRVGVVWEFAPQQTLYAQYQDAVAANNPGLKAERAKQIEIGWKHAALHGRFNTTVALYQLVKRNRADYSLFPVVTTTGQARSRGLEVDALGELTPQLALMASYAYQDAVVTEDEVFKGTRLANAARHSGSVWARWMLDAQWAAGAGVFFQSQRQGDQANTFQLPGFGRVDAMASYAFTTGAGKASVQLNLKNVFDKRYYSGSHQFVKDWIAPGAPRTASITLRFDH